MVISEIILFLPGGVSSRLCLLAWGSWSSAGCLCNRGHCRE